ncbi:MAG: hypothetical protein PWQ88_840 [Candidatus Methanomethylophilaceae archaeon]|nr:hypothetical protein [Candidatus Methanomethylophilaceae archaeon]MDI3541236.1 hypothetical protein [Candidatus Methanomethylophilaceae archaeon]HIJ00718.1 helix-turn-helix domain-containing protein [Candidatus Methanomethylophilaceae archaeon]
MSLVNELAAGMLRKEGGFQEALRKILEEDLNMSVTDFCKVAEISPSTIYKILEEQREPNLRTVRQIIKAVRRISPSPFGHFVAVIASRPVLQSIEEHIVQIGDEQITVKEYPASTVEDAIVASVRAEREGALAVVCAPIIAPTVEKILTVPVSVIIPGNSIIRAIENVRDQI